jgi:hypothetical protein
MEFKESTTATKTGRASSAIEQHLLAYYLGIAVIFGSHAYILYAPTKPLMTIQQHSYINLLAGLLIAYYFMHSQGYIKF